MTDSNQAESAGSPARPTVRQMMRPTTTIEEGAHVAAAAYLIKHFHDVGLVVLGAGSDEPIATITDTEIVKAIADGQDLEDARILEVVAENPVAVDPDVHADDAARLMLSQGLDSLPVMQGRRIIGIVELADVRGMSQGSGPATAPRAAL